MDGQVTYAASPSRQSSYGGLDWFRLAAALLVITIHTSPLASFGGEADFVLTRILARVAVPFFFMTSGFFLFRGINDGKTGALARFLKKTGLIYLVSILLYAPLSIITGQLSLAGFFRQIIFDGTFYHLWYLPAAMLGMLIVYPFLRKKQYRWAGLLCALLYLVGLFGDSYYGLGAALPAVKSIYDVLFGLFSYTRNGLFFAPMFFYLGGMLSLRKRCWSLSSSLFGAVLSLSGMLAEGLVLHYLGVQRHDSMYVFLLPLMVFLYDLLLHARVRAKPRLRTLALIVYLAHPACILLVRLAAKLSGQSWLIGNSLSYFFFTALTSLVFALLASKIADRLTPGRGGGGKTASEHNRPSRRKKEERSRVWAEIDLRALRHNVDQLRRFLPPSCALMAVLKADAYGHGAVKLARQLRHAGVKAFAVATCEEGVRLRRGGIRGTILVLGYTPPALATRLHRYRLTQTVFDLLYAQALAENGLPLRVHIKVDTGMHRLGIPDAEFEAISALYAVPPLRVSGIFSHLCVADSEDPADIAYTNQQARRFQALVDKLRARRLPPGKIHLQNSYGIAALPGLVCDYARAGLFLYGLYGSLAQRQRAQEQHAPGGQSGHSRQPEPPQATDHHRTTAGDAPSRPLTAGRVLPDLQPLLSLRARIASVRTLAAGEGVGYGREYVTRHTSRLAVVCAGYADGIPRTLGGKGRVLVKGQYAPIVGRICMDQLMIDVSAIPTAAAGDTVTLIGRDGDHVLYAEEMAALASTIPNEIVSRLGSRPQRRYFHAVSWYERIIRAISGEANGKTRFLLPVLPRKHPLATPPAMK